MVALSQDWWRHDNGPLLGYTHDARPVALLTSGARGYRMVDPVAGTTTPVSAAVAATLSPKGYMFYRPFPNVAMTAWRAKFWTSSICLSVNGRTCWR